MKNKITQCLWFDTQGETAAKFYASIFKKAFIGKIGRYQTETPSNKPEGSVMTVNFSLENLDFMALNGGPVFKPNPSISFFIHCESEAEVAYFWDKFLEGGTVLMPLDEYEFSKKYGWIQDKYGFSWQVILPDPKGDVRPKMMPSLLFTDKKSGSAKTAIDFYTEVFKNTKIGKIAPNETQGAEGTTAYADFMLEGHWFVAMDSPQEHDFDFNEGISFVVHCKDQKEIDYYWGKLSAVPESEQCGWLKDKFGVSWQIVPENLGELISSKAAMEAMLKMKKLNIEGLMA